VLSVADATVSGGRKPGTLDAQQLRRRGVDTGRNGVEAGLGGSIAAAGVHDACVHAHYIYIYTCVSSGFYSSACNWRDRCLPALPRHRPPPAQVVAADIGLLL